MELEIYDDIALEQHAKAKFGMDVDIDHVIVRNVPVSHVARATLFLTKKKQLLVYIEATSRLGLGDVRKLVSRMGLKAELYIPPKGRPNYFDEIGKQKFSEVFPGRHNPSHEDIQYYRTLAPYNPALVQIHEVKNGHVYQFDTDASSDWRVSAKFTYRRIKTS